MFSGKVLFCRFFYLDSVQKHRITSETLKLFYPFSLWILNKTFIQDIIRARYYQTFGSREFVNLQTGGDLASQTFIKKYMSLEEKGHPVDSLWETTVQVKSISDQNNSKNFIILNVKFSFFFTDRPWS